MKAIKWTAGMIAVLILLAASLGAMAEAGRPNDKGGGRGDDSMGLLNEGIAYMSGDGVEQDYDAAMQRFLSADEAGNRKAARYVGLMYERGLGVEQDYAEAATWYEKGVACGDLTSGYYLGLLYKQGFGVGQDYAKAAELFESVAGSDNKSATGVLAAGCELALLYEQGLGVEKDLDKAIALYQEGAEYGDSESKAALERLGIE